MSEKSGQLLASLSLDLDNQWSYMKTHGDKGWTEYPTYLDWAVPRVLEFLDRRKLKISFFIVGRDAIDRRNGSALCAIAEGGHEIGNHSFNHEPWLHLYTHVELDQELEKAEEAIEAATGVCPRAFRGPGFSLSAATLQVLAARGYQYDATVFPNVLNPLARAYFFATSSLTDEEKEQRKELFGTWRDALRPVSPFNWRVGESVIREIPVTTMPFFKTPIHLSYVLYAARFSRRLAIAYFQFGIAMCRVSGVTPSILLHPLDFIGGDDVGDLAFFPGMDLEWQYKKDVIHEVLDILEKWYSVTTVGEHLSHFTNELPTYEFKIS
ncbi:MAG: polysaccharide deacetylase family protein [Gammaproteobacteria bacterium]|nr:polysaccharide deacetylase family protein [Gammaproteobacteria bacterium]MDH5261584.1 polysaccharide deacetylase family protein [Gammaproteobacteria bacterium]